MNWTACAQTTSGQFSVTTTTPQTRDCLKIYMQIKDTRKFSSF